MRFQLDCAPAVAVAVALTVLLAPGGGLVEVAAGPPVRWVVRHGRNCLGSGPDLLRGFLGNATVCKAKCETLGTECAGFVRVLEGSSAELGGHCFFRSGSLGPPHINQQPDARHCYIPLWPGRSAPDRRPDAESARTPEDFQSPPPALDTALADLAQHRQLLVVFVSREVVDFLQNWMCSLRHFSRKPVAVLLAAIDPVCPELEPWMGAGSAVVWRCVMILQRSDGASRGRKGGRRRARPTSVTYGSPAYLQNVRRKLRIMLHITSSPILVR